MKNKGKYADAVTSESEMETVQSVLSLQDEYPDLVKKWSPDNPLELDQYFPHSGKKVLWNCSVAIMII